MSISPETFLVIEPPVALRDAGEALRTAAAESFLDRAEAFLTLGTAA